LIETTVDRDILSSTEKVDGMFASMIVALPSTFTGGEVHVSHGVQQNIFDIAPSASYSTSVLAWYTDVIHEVKPLTSGYRLALSYNLINTSPGIPPPTLPDMHNAISTARRIFHKWATNGYPATQTAGGLVACILRHQYSNVGFENMVLKGEDRNIISNIQRVAAEAGISLYLASLEASIVGQAVGGDCGYERREWYPIRDYISDDSDSNHEMDYAEEEKYRLSAVYGLDGKPVESVKNAILDKKHLIPEKPLEGLSPDKEDFEGYTGNVSDSPPIVVPQLNWVICRQVPR
jgi:hypothetical protein